jgi:hypothetical protein
MNKYLMQYNGKKAKIDLSRHPAMTEKYIFGKGDKFLMAVEDAKWFMENDPKFLTYIKTIDYVQKTKAQTPPAAPLIIDTPEIPAESSEQQEGAAEDLLKDDTPEPELTGDGADGDGDLPPKGSYFNSKWYGRIAIDTYALKDDTPEPELTGDGADGDGDLPPPEELKEEANDEVPVKTPMELNKMTYEGLVEYAAVFGILPDLTIKNKVQSRVDLMTKIKKVTMIEVK